MILSISSFEIMSVVRFDKSEGCIPDLNISLFIHASAADADASLNRNAFS